MDINIVKRIKDLVIISLASDDNLVERLVLKGGNAIELAFKNHSISRTSYDLDYSIVDGDFVDNKVIEERIRKTLEQTFLENGYVVFDYKFNEKPKTENIKLSDFWGGYCVDFKVIEKHKFDEDKSKIDSNRRNAINLYPNNSTKFEIEISKYEYVGQKKEVNLEGFKLYATLQL